MRRRVSGTLQVALPPAEAFRLFTPRGEEDWVAGWRPQFPDPTTDDTRPGTVFLTDADGVTTTWVVLDRRPGHSVSYARVTESRAGTVTVTLERAPDPHVSMVTVTYDITALTDAAKADLDEFADGYPAFLRSWQDAIEVWLSEHSAS
ncbi:MAG TPA: SRPBCC family protein [Jiangellaceae bacterium]|nr:SRPBCC family protein [Jiangellaceae bacterium]